MKTTVVVIALLSVACSSPTAPMQPAPIPQPTPTAELATDGNLTAANCVFVDPNFTCEFSAPATNTGTGCAQNIRGMTQTFSPKPFDTPLGSTTWTYQGGIVRPGDHFMYSGRDVVIPKEPGWTYQTAFQWENVVCP